MTGGYNLVVTRTEIKNAAEAIASLSLPEHQMLDVLFKERPDLEALFVNLVSRKIEALQEGNAQLLHRINEEEKQMFDTALRQILTKPHA